MQAQIKKQIIEIAQQDLKLNGSFAELEFKKSVYRVFVIRKMIARFLNLGVVNEKLLTNNIIITINTFGIEKTNVILRLVLNNDEFSIAKSILMFIRCYTLNSDVTPSNPIFNSIMVDTAVRYNIDHEHVPRNYYVTP